ncbi:IPT/TIG domain-containing protein [Clostridium sp. CF012]|uniref:IPT/TIG domain-containing protein n=1 Tax=Clostridium sp. CF012 TaxID=2843319 RepID=UPI001C0D8E32|nr:IPT/TIG domain-containing protein [Clostridium sp. CF012]MBU3143470.1 hypothetical protein [Clostridium sp. CF012]
MSKLEKIYAITIIVFPLILISTLTFFLHEDITIDSLSQETIFRKHETNLINDQVSLEIKGTGFKENDKIYLNGEEQTTAFGGEDILTCLIPKVAYSEVEKIEVTVKRFNTSNKVIAKSNLKKIKIADVKEKTTKVIEEISPKQIEVMQKENLIDGKVAISVIGSGFKEDDKIYINNEMQITSFGGEKLVTCLVPKKFYVKPQELDIQIKQTLKVEQVEVSNYLKIEVVEKDTENK